MSADSAGTHKFKVGEVVQLNSGGPRMTVMGTENGETTAMVLCEWFDKEQKLRRHNFPVTALGHAQPTIADVREFLSGTEK
jgi:uncharacterized protein YodC (DUF2158 family)